MKTAEEILKRFLWDDPEGGLNVCELDALTAMKEFAAQEVAKALQMLAGDNEDDDKIDLSQPDDLSFLRKPTDEDIEEWARSESIAKVEDEDGNIQEFVTPIMEWLIKGAKAALSGEIKKKVK